MTPRAERHLLEHVARDDYCDSAKDVEVFGWKVSLETPAFATAA
jgi:hypothetical protein